MKTIADIRNEYTLKELDLHEVSPNPLDQFKKWLQEAIDSKVVEPTAMTLTTVSAQGSPSSRVVLLKGVEEHGFKFFTNYNSHKAQEIQKNPHVSLNFFWGELERQVRIEGSIHKLSEEESDLYFQSRPRESQIGAWVSPQSKIIKDREFLLNEFEKLSTQYKGKNIPKPPYWGGYNIHPLRIEFWQGRPNRLHDRILYQRDSEINWKIVRLAP